MPSPPTSRPCGVAASASTQPWTADLASLEHDGRERSRARRGGSPALLSRSHVDRAERPATGRPAAPRRGSVIGLPLSSATERTAPWEAATAVVDVLARRSEVSVEVLATDRRVLDLLGDHPLLAHTRVRTVAPPRVLGQELLEWVQRIDLLLLSYRQPTDTGWLSLCAELAIGVVSVASPAMSDRGLVAGYEPGPLGMVDVDEVAQAVIAGLDRERRSSRPRRRRSRLTTVRTTDLAATVDADDDGRDRSDRQDSP